MFEGSSIKYGAVTADAPAKDHKSLYSTIYYIYNMMAEKKNSCLSNYETYESAYNLIANSLDLK